MNFFYKQEKFKANVSFQNVRVWGDVATTSPSDKNGVALFESWISYDFNTIGQLNSVDKYFRMTIKESWGGIDWLQQGQSHDAVLITNKKNNYQLDFGAALNNNNEALYESAYVTNYKTCSLFGSTKNFQN